MSIRDCKKINLKKISDPRGNLTVVESLKDIPFEIKRIYYIYDVPADSSRGGHAHKTLEQVMIALSGSFDVILDDGFNRKRITLNRPYIGLYISKMIWSEMNNFSSGSVCLVIASDYYKEDDYIRDYNEFIKLVGVRNESR